MTRDNEGIDSTVVEKETKQVSGQLLLYGNRITILEPCFLPLLAEHAQSNRLTRRNEADLPEQHRAQPFSFIF